MQLSELTPKEKAEVITRILKAIADCIKGHENGLPAGVLYSQLMQFDLGLQQFEKIIQGFIDAKLITAKGNLLFWKQQ